MAGKQLLTQRLQAPFSYQVRWQDFAKTVELRERDGRLVRSLGQIALKQGVPVDGVITGPRQYWTSPAAGFDPPSAEPTPGPTLTSTMSSAPDGTTLERIQGYITAPATGIYTFWLSASGPAEFWLADSDQPGDPVRRARVPVASGVSQWDADPAQQSMRIALTAGKTYCFDLLHRPAASGAHLGLAWRRPAMPAPARRMRGPMLSMGILAVGAAIGEARSAP